jgi:hypothetical protein
VLVHRLLPLRGGGAERKKPPFFRYEVVRPNHSFGAGSLRLRRACTGKPSTESMLPRRVEKWSPPKAKGGGVTDFVGTPATSRYAERGYRRPSEALIGVATSKTTTNLLDEVQPRGGERAQFKGP